MPEEMKKAKKIKETGVQQHQNNRSQDFE